MKNEKSYTCIYEQFLASLWFIIPSYISVNDIKHKSVEEIHENPKLSKKVFLKFL